MFDFIGTLDNFAVVNSVVLDESQPKGYRLEERLQATVKSASNEKGYTVEYRLGEDSQAPSETQLNTRIETCELVQAFCTGLTARPFVHQEGKNYQARGSEREINGGKAVLDSFVILAGFAMAPLGSGPALEDMVKQAREAYKRSQRQYRAQRNAERAKQQESQLEERARQLLERKAQQEAEKAAQAAGGSAEVDAAAAVNGRRR